MTRMRSLSLGVLLFLFFLPLYGQVKDTDVLFTVGDDTVTVEEFKHMYLKNINQTGDTYQSPKEYLDLYIDFKLKVHEARAEGYDTVPSYIQELARYRKQLAEPYVVDPAVMDSLMHEGYEHMKKEVDASHILIRVGETEDTTEAWDKIMEVRSKLLAGVPFGEMARAVSDDPSAKNNGGNIGFFTAFQMVYPFEEAAYRLQPGELSMPVRTRFGYHLIRVDSVRPNPGKIRVAHIMIAVPRRASKQVAAAAKDTIFMIWDKLKKGADFETLAKKYSQDYGTARTGGVLPWFGPGRMIPSFAEAAFALKHDGDISEPVRTPYGWHIIKRLAVKPLGSYEELKPELKKMVSRSDRLKYARDREIVTLMKKHHAVADTALLERFAAEATIDAHRMKWTFPPQTGDQTVFTYLTLTVPFKAFYNYVKKVFIPENTPVDEFVKNEFDKFARQRVLNYRQAHLEEEYPEFGAIMKEYSEGMLMFNIMDDKVWSKAVKDTTGLKKYYEKHQEKYMTPEKMVADHLVLKDKTLLKKVQKEVKKSLKKGIPLTDVVDKYNKGGARVLTLAQDTLVRGQGTVAGKVTWKKGAVSVVDEPQGVGIWHVVQIIPRKAKPLKEEMGIVTSDYQDYLEKQWVAGLKKKYTVDVHKEVFARLEKELKKERK